MKTAQQGYLATRAKIARVLDLLDSELEHHSERAKADPANRGFEGDLGKVRGDLVNLVAFLSGMEADAIVECLDDDE